MVFKIVLCIRHKWCLEKFWHKQLYTRKNTSSLGREMLEYSLRALESRVEDEIKIG
jgi:hypothetical protein